MATINFPSSPTLNDQYSFEGKTWTFNGDGWVLTSTPTTIRIDSAFDTANALSANIQYAWDAANTANANFLESSYKAVAKLSMDYGSTELYFPSHYSDGNPDLYITSGESIAIGLYTGTNPFTIRYTANGQFYNIGLTHVSTEGVISQGFNAQGKTSGTLFIDAPIDRANTSIVYQGSFSNTASFTGNIKFATPNPVFQETISTTVQNIYDVANTAAGGADSWARLQSNAAFAQANVANTLAQAAFDAANNATDSWVRDAANSASSYANSAYDQANTANTLAQAAFDYANTIVTDTKLTVASVNESNVFSNIITNVTTLGFDTFTGFHVTDLGSGNVKISLGSTFSVWNVPGQDDLTAVGDDTIRILSANGISISTNNSSTPKEISFDGSIIFDQANAAFEAANNATDSWVRDAANSAGVYANAAYDAANAAYALAQSGGTPLSGQFDYGLIIDATSTIQDYGTL